MAAFLVQGASRNVAATLDSTCLYLLVCILVYYQWVPFMLGLQCILFYIPRVIWQAICYNRTGTDLENICQKAVDAVRVKVGARKEACEDIAASIEQLLFQVNL